MKIEEVARWQMEGGDWCIQYHADEFLMEVFVLPNGNADMRDGDANPEQAHRTAKAWKAWAKFAKRKNKEGWL